MLNPVISPSQCECNPGNANTLHDHFILYHRRVARRFIDLASDAAQARHPSQVAKMPIQTKIEREHDSKLNVSWEELAHSDSGDSELRCCRLL